MLTNIFNLLHTVFNVIVNFVSGTLGMVLSLHSASELVLVVIGYIPAVLAGAITCTVAILIIKFVLGR